MSIQLSNGSIISDEEVEATRQVLRAGKKYGYGNMIAHLETAWRKHLMDEYQFTEKGAIQRTGPGYPLEWTLPFMESNHERT